VNGLPPIVRAREASHVAIRIDGITCHRWLIADAAVAQWTAVTGVTVYALGGVR
jgi:hypothetical protein